MALPAGSTPAPVTNKMPPAVKPGTAKRPLKKPGAKLAPKRKALAASTVPGNPYAQQAQKMVDPIIAALTAQYEGNAKNSDAAISQLTNQYAKELGQINYAQPYNSAETQQAAIDAALQQSATGQGSSLADSLSQALQALQGSSGANAVNQAAQQLAAQGRGIGSAELASGSAELGNLVSDAAAARSYGQKMPGIAKLAGMQGIEQSQGLAQQGIQNATTQIEGELPSIEQDLMANKLNAKANKLAAKEKMAALNSENRYRQGELALRGQQIQSTNAYHAAEIQARQQSLGLEAQRLASSQKIDWARLGLESKRLRMEVAKAQLSAHSGGLSPTTKAEKTAEANGWAQRTLGMTTDPNTMVKGPNGNYIPKKLPKLSVPDAVNQMLAHGIPLKIAVNQMAKVMKQNGASNGQITALRKHYGELGAALNRVARLPLLPGTGRALGSLVFAGEKGLTSKAQKTIVTLAHEYMGTPYVWGGESPKGFDCSGFAQYLYGKAGISIPRTTYTQWTAGRPVKQGQLRPGDLVFFKGSDSRGGLPGHVGIYIGGGKMIDAPHTGSDVRIDNIASFGGYMGARRYGNG